ncbi:MAG: hypothetical protein IJB03_02480 [Alistipes sp.]|nr:hypothetical protein [Alistipes sp.]
MSSQEWIVLAVAVVVAIVLVRKVWRFFTCGPTSSCDGCGKDCPHRK